MSLGGRVAVVTGAARGLGRALALRLAREGAIVSCWDLNERGAIETAQLLASDDADYITGHTLSVNGGRHSN